MPTRDEIQAEAIESIFRERDAGKRSTLLQMPTQTGKTRTAVKYSRPIIDEHGGRILVLTDRGELINQWKAEYETARIHTLIEKGEQSAWLSMVHRDSDWEPAYKVCLGSKDSFQDRGSSRRLSRWPKDFFTDIIVDECDLALADTWLNVIRYFDSAFILGLTATIDRGDGRKLSELFESTAFCYSIGDAIANGHRVPFRGVACDVDIDIRELKPVRDGKLPQAELAEILGPKLEQIANVVKSHFDRLNINKAVAFLPGGRGCWLAYAFAQILSQIGLPSEAVDGKNKARDSIISRFRSDGFRVLCNTGLFGRGFSDTKIDAVIHLNPTMSRALYDQRSGRCGATREATDTIPAKEFGYLLHPCWKTDLELVGPTDIFAEHVPLKVKNLARKLSQLAKDADPQRLIEQAKEIIEREEEQSRRKLMFQAQRQEVRHKYREYDPIRVASPWIKEASDESNSYLSPSYRRELADLGIDAAGVTDAIAPGLIHFWNERYLCGMSTQKQVKLLTKRGWKLEKAMDMSNREAQEVIRKFYVTQKSFSY